MSNTHTRLPKEYREVEYIATDGNAYINTSFIPNISKIYDFYGKFYVSERGDQVILGTREDTGNTRFFPFAIANSNDVTKTNIGYTSYQYGEDAITVSVGQEYQTHFEQGRQTWGLVGGTLRTMSMSFTSGFTFTKPLHLFRANHTSPTPCRNNLRCYYIKAYENNTLVLELIPCYRKSDNVIGVYDLVSKTFFSNAGEGSLTKGDDVYYEDENKHIQTRKFKSLLGKQDYLREDTTYERMPEYMNVANGVFIRRNRTTTSIIPYRFNISLDATHTYFIGIMFNETVSDLSMYNFDATNSTNTNVSNKITINNFVCGTVTGVQKIDSIHFYTGVTGGIPKTTRPLYTVYIDLTAIGLATLTPQQFYDKYNSILEDIAGNKLNVVKKIYASKFKNIISNGTLERTKTPEAQTYDAILYPYYPQYDFGVIDTTHKYFIYVEVELNGNDTINNVSFASEQSSKYVIDEHSKICSINTSNITNPTIYLYGNFTGNYISKNRIMIDLTSLGLDTLTAQQFYDKYHTLFSEIASGKPNEVLFKYSGCNAKNMLGDMTDLVFKESYQTAKEIWFGTKTYDVGTPYEVESFSIPIQQGHKYMFVVKWEKEQDRTMSSENYDSIHFMDSSYNMLGGETYFVNGYYNSQEKIRCMAHTSTASGIASYVRTYINGDITFDATLDVPEYLIVIDMTELGIDTLTPEQFYNKYHKVLDKMASGRTGEVFRAYDSKKDLGSFTWFVSNSETGIVGTTGLQGIIKNSTSNIYCGRYDYGNPYVYNECVFVESNGAVDIRSSAFIGKTATEVKQLLSGVILYYDVN